MFDDNTAIRQNRHLLVRTYPDVETAKASTKALHAEAMRFDAEVTLIRAKSWMRRDGRVNVALEYDVIVL